MTNPKHLVKGDMNKDNLHALIDRYEENYYYLNGVGPNEKFKYWLRCHNYDISNYSRA